MHKAHEKIWLQVDPDGESCDPEQYDLEDDCTWCKEQINENDVAYIRADLVESLRQQLTDSQKREVMLRDALDKTESYLVQRGIESRGIVGRTEILPAIRGALAATADLDGLILCHAEPVATVFREYGGSGAVHLTDLEDGTPLYRAWGPKEQEK